MTSRLCFSCFQALIFFAGLMGQGVRADSSSLTPVLKCESLLSDMGRKSRKESLQALGPLFDRLTGEGSYEISHGLKKAAWKSLGISMRQLEKVQSLRFAAVAESFIDPENEEWKIADFLQVLADDSHQVGRVLAQFKLREDYSAIWRQKKGEGAATFDLGYILGQNSQERVYLAVQGLPASAGVEFDSTLGLDVHCDDLRHYSELHPAERIRTSKGFRCRVPMIRTRIKALVPMSLPAQD